MGKMKWYDWTAVVLLIVGGINWGLVGAFSYNLVESIFASIPYAVNVIYSAVGISALYSLYVFAKK